MAGDRGRFVKTPFRSVPRPWTLGAPVSPSSLQSQYFFGTSTARARRADTRAGVAARGFGLFLCPRSDVRLTWSASLEYPFSLFRYGNESESGPARLNALAEPRPVCERVLAREDLASPEPAGDRAVSDGTSLQGRFVTGRGLCNRLRYTSRGYN